MFAHKMTLWRKWKGKPQSKKNVCRTFSGKMFSGLDLEYIKSLVDQQYEEQPTEKMGKRHEQT